MFGRRTVVSGVTLGLLGFGMPSLAAEPAAQVGQRAVRRGLGFLYRLARQPRVMQASIGDLLWCFASVAATDADPDLARMAALMGEERARARRASPARAAARSTAGEVFDAVYRACGAERLGAPDLAFHRRLQREAVAFGALDYLNFDPDREGAPDDVPQTCARCGHDNARGASRCAHCGARLVMRSRYDVFTDALIITYVGDRCGIRLGATHAEVARHALELRPYPDARAGDYADAAYAVTHLIYSANDYSQRRLDPALWPAEVAFLRANYAANIARRDGELTGEFMDTLKAFGLGAADPPITRGARLLLATQRADGGWGDPGADPLQRLHPTWTAIDGLRAYRFAPA